MVFFNRQRQVCLFNLWCVHPSMSEPQNPFFLHIKTLNIYNFWLKIGYMLCLSLNIKLLILSCVWARPCLSHSAATIFPLVLRAGRKQSIIFRRIVCPQKRVWKNHIQNLVTLFASVSRLGAYKSHENQKELLQQQNQPSSSQDICFLTKTSFFPCHLNVKIQNHYPIYLELKYLKTWFPTQ